MRKAKASQADSTKQNENIDAAKQLQTIADASASNEILPDVGNVAVLQKELNMLKANLKEAKILLQKSGDINLEKDMQISRLTENQSNKSGDPEEFLADFKQKFGKSEMKEIKSVGPGQRNDSKFILKIMENLYRNDERDKLKFRSASGKQFKGEKKTEISFEKRAIMDKMLSERLKFELDDETSSEFGKRFRNMNRMIKNAIHNIMRKCATKKRGREDVEEDGLASKKAKGLSSF